MRWAYRKSCLCWATCEDKLELYEYKWNLFEYFYFHLTLLLLISVCLHETLWYIPYSFIRILAIPIFVFISILNVLFLDLEKQSVTCLCLFSLYVSINRKRPLFSYQHKCYIVATCDRDLKRRIRKVHRWICSVCLRSFRQLYY